MRYSVLIGFLYFLVINKSFSESYDNPVGINTQESNFTSAQENFNTYYISISGNNNNSGLSPAAAWQTIGKVNSVDFGPGDRILFKGGETFFGNLVFDLNDDGSIGNYIQIGSFGTGRAMINAGNSSGLTAVNCDYLKIKNIDFTGNGRKTGNTGNGLSFSYCTNIVVDSINVRNFQHSGVLAQNQGKNLSFTNINSTDNGFAGIYINGLSKSSMSDIYIGYSNTSNNPGDPTVTNNHSGNGILAFNAKKVLIEYCRASNNGWDMPRIGNGPGGIWFAEVDSSVIQYCISHDNKTSVGGQDGLGFDFDGGTTNSIIQYCLSYNNQGAGYGIFQYSGASNWYNNVVRYCISENDGNVSARASVVFWNGTNVKSKFQGFEFYNNVIYNKNGVALAFLDHLNSNFNFRNNIFVSKNKSVYNNISGENFQGNCWYALDNIFYLNSALDFNTWALSNNQEMLNGSVAGIFANPYFVSPGNTNITDPRQLRSLVGYQLATNSAAINKGLNLNQLFGLNTGGNDFYGNQGIAGLTTDMGIFEYQGTVNQPDIEKPVITTFSIPATSSSLTVSVTVFSATDNIGLTGYKLTETPNAPLAGDAGWSAVAPAFYTFNTEGTKTLYAWAKDAAGNVSMSKTSQVVVTLMVTDTISIGNSEVYSNIIKWGNQLAMPVTFSENGKIISLSIYHEGGTGNLLLGVYSDQAGYPSARLGISASTVIKSTAGWQTVLLTSPLTVSSGQKVWLSWVFQNNPGIRYTTGTPGRAVSSYTWASGMPAAFGTSTIAPTKYSIYCNYISGNDNIAPVISTFNLPATSSSLTVAVTGFSATDNISVTGYKLTETPNAPLAGDAGWSAVAPAFYTFNTEGTKTLYAWAKDAAGNVSMSKTSQVVVTLVVTDTISIGNSEVYSNIIKWGNQLAMPVTFSEDGKIFSLSIYHEGGTGNLLLGVYSDQAGYPSARLGISASTVIKSTAGWQTVLLTTPLTVSSGQKVWLSWVFQNNPGIRYITGTPGRAVSSYTWASGMPAAFGTSTIAPTKYSIYCTYITQNGLLKSLNAEQENKIIPEVKPQVIYYPNPTAGKINIELNNIDLKNLKLALFSSQGSLIRELRFDSEYSEINISELNNGIYFAVLSNSENGIIFNSTRIIVKH